MPQFWIAIFFILLAIVELYQSIKEIALPFPVYLVLGTLLAVASNYQHKFSVDRLHQVAGSEIKESDPVLNATSLPSLPTAVDSIAQIDRLSPNDRG